jgi:excinuclease UvrABC ATPase subunit
MESLIELREAVRHAGAKPDVDFVFGLSPVISIEQKTLTTTPFDRRHDDRQWRAI